VAFVLVGNGLVSVAFVLVGNRIAPVALFVAVFSAPFIVAFCVGAEVVLVVLPIVTFDSTPTSCPEVSVELGSQNSPLNPSWHLHSEKIESHEPWSLKRHLLHLNSSLMLSLPSVY